MDSNTISLIFTAIACSAGATWAVHSAITKVGDKLANHVAEDKIIHADVIELKDAAKRRKGRR
jgi:hypothetical protein